MPTTTPSSTKPSRRPTKASPEPRKAAEALGISPDMLTAVLAKQRRRERRRKAVTRPPPRPMRPEHPTHVLGSDGRLCVSVGLSGRRGEGRRVVLDALVWDRLRRSHGDRWTLKEVGKHDHVVAMAPFAGVSMARLIVGAGAGEAVMLRNGPLDLCRGALEVVEKRGAVRRALGH